MTGKRFERLIEAYGADPDRWPAAERAAAERHLAVSAEARALWEEQRRLDLRLDRYALPQPDRALAGRMAAGAVAASQHQPRQEPRLWAAFRPFWSPQLVGMATACAVALALILFDPVDPVAEPSADIIVIAGTLDGLEGGR